MFCTKHAASHRIVDDRAVCIIHRNLFSFGFFLDTTHVSDAHLVDRIILVESEYLLYFGFHLVGIKQAIYQFGIHIVLWIAESYQAVSILVQLIHVDFPAVTHCLEHV